MNAWTQERLKLAAANINSNQGRLIGQRRIAAAGREFRARSPLLWLDGMAEEEQVVVLKVLGRHGGCGGWVGGVVSAR